MYIFLTISRNCILFFLFLFLFLGFSNSVSAYTDIQVFPTITSNVPDYTATNALYPITSGGAGHYQVCNSLIGGYRNTYPATSNPVAFYSLCSIGLNWNYSGGSLESVYGGLGDGTYWTFTDYYENVSPYTVVYRFYAVFTRTGGVWTTPAAPTCSDGIQNQNETAIDFGGICPETETISANITTSTTWNRGHLYLISGDIEITTGDTLTIEPGTIVKFDTATPSSLTVNGILVAEGDLGNEQSLGKIFFTSLKDDRLLGLDTNTDGNSTSPAGGDWGGITIGPGGVGIFDNVIIRYAGDGGSTSQLYNDGGTLTMENSGVVYGTTYGIYSDSGTSDISDSELGFHDYGFYLNGGTADVTPNNTIHDNSSYGIYNDTVSSIDAEDNYWGDSTGPDGVGPGSGDSVSSYVDYDPWTDDRHYILNEADEGYCNNYNECTSVYADELQWKNVDVSSYTTELSSALSTWDALTSVDMIEDNSTPALEIYEDSLDDVSWKGIWIPEESPDKIVLNSYYLDSNTSSQIQNTIAHELGHALGLGHSYTGNVMYFNQTSQTTLGDQDLSDYYYLWP